VASNLSEFAQNPTTGAGGFYGTSAAAPHVAGAAALVLAANPALDASDLEALLERRASPVVNPATNDAGHGVLQLGDPLPSGIQPVAGSNYVALAQPVRVANTTKTSVPRLATGKTITVKLPSSVPSDATAVVVNLGGVNATGATTLAAFPDKFAGTSNLNLSLTDPVAAVLATVKVNAAHSFIVQNNGSAVSVYVDLLGYFAAPTSTAGAGYFALPAGNANRIYDSRHLPAPGGGQQHVPLAARQTITVTVPAGLNVPLDAALAVNLTVTNQTGAGYLTAFSVGTTYTGTSSLNYLKFTRANMAVVRLVNGSFQLSNTGTAADAVVDVVGYFGTGPGNTAGARYVALPSPVRISDSRYGNGVARGALTTATNPTYDGAGYFGVPHTATAVWTGMTAVSPANGYFTVYPQGSPVPLTSSLNFSNNRPVPNAVLAPLSAPTSALPGQFQVHVAATSQVVVDLFGYFAVPAG
jgi:hypothetical protein